MKCEYHDRLENKIDTLCELTAETREDVAFLKGRITESKMSGKVLGILSGTLITIGGGIAWLLSRFGG